MTAPLPPDPADVLTRLEELHKAATPGEWRWNPEYGTEGDTGLALTNEAGDEIVGAYNYHCCSFRDDPNVNDADAAAIVAEHNAMPALLAAVRGVLALADDLDSYVAARGKPVTGTYDDGLNRAQAATAADLRSAITAALEGAR